MAYCELPKWNLVSGSGYHMRGGGVTALTRSFTRMPLWNETFREIDFSVILVERKA